MFYITDTFNIESVSINNIANLRFEEITAEQLKKMCDDSPKIVAFHDRKALGAINRLLGEIHQASDQKGILKLDPTDVLVLFQRRKFSTVADQHKFFKVTCRRDFEVFGFDDKWVILDRDGNVHDKATDESCLEKLHATCRNLNGGA